LSEKKRAVFEWVFEPKFADLLDGA